MTEHAEIMTAMQSKMEAFDGAVSIMPSALAMATYQEISPDQSEDRLISYLSVQMLTVMARGILGKKFSHNSDETEAYDCDLFSNALQLRYPLPRARGVEPTYKLRGHLTAEERAWNVEQLRKSSKARLEHADALEAEAWL
jgi:hypothetical protein